MNDALDDILADSDDEEEEAAIVNKVLDEIGIEISGKVRQFLRVISSIMPILWAGISRSMGMEAIFK